jgi:triacylglycerol lipase
VKHYIYLVPGFFGFANLGELRYFGHVRDFLARELSARGQKFEIAPSRRHPHRLC